MAADTQNPQKRSQGDFAARLAADSYFEDITVLEQNKGVTEDDVTQALGVLNEKNGKIGAIAIVLMPELVPSNADTPGPEYKVRGTVQVITAALFNEGENGTGKTAESIARRVRQLLHRYDGGWGTWSFAGMEPLPVAEGQVSYGVVFTRLGRDVKFAKLATPLIDPDAAALPVNVTITAQPESEIYYTEDGSYPHPDNPEATLYSAPVAIAEATTLRAVAYKTGYQPSNVAGAEYGTNYEFSEEFSDEFA